MHACYKSNEWITHSYFTIYCYKCVLVFSFPFLYGDHIPQTIINCISCRSITRIK